jgi:hypothetical protein
LSCTSWIGTVPVEFDGVPELREDAGEELLASMNI